MTAELAEGWQPIFYLPGEGRRACGATPLAAGHGQAGSGAGPLDVVAQAPLAIGDDVARPTATWPGRCFALYIGGMGARGPELLQRPGRPATATRPRPSEIQDAYLDGRKDEAAALVPAELLEGTSLIGPGRLRRASGSPRSARPGSPR